jgi:hypothetical protein
LEENLKFVQELNKMKEVLESMGMEDLNLLDTWYKTDTNAIPHVSVLQPIDTFLGNI